MPTDDRQHRYTAAWRRLCGLAPLDHPSFARVSRVWRAEMHPTFHDDVAVTVTDIDAGGWIEVRALPMAARTWAMAEAGYGGVARPSGDPPRPGVWEATVTADALDALAAAMPRLPLHSPTGHGRDGMVVDCSAVLDGTPHAFSWSTTAGPAPLHHAYVTSLCSLAVARLTDPAAVALVQALAPYLR